MTCPEEPVTQFEMWQLLGHKEPGANEKVNAFSYVFFVLPGRKQCAEGNAYKALALGVRR